MSGNRSSIGYLVVGTLIIALAGRAAGWLSDETADLVFLVSFGWFAYSALVTRIRATPAALAVLSLVLGLIALRQSFPSLRYMPFLMIAPVNFALAAIFARGLMPGRRPVLLKLIDIIGMAPAEDLAFQRFVARQCLLWSLMALATGLLALGGIFVEAARPAISLALQVLIGAQVVWFALSHHYASLRYRRPETWWTTLKTMAQPGVWSRLGKLS
ncbi:hypothetical protein M1105_05365 [Limibaculum sp. FT325]|uniref:hypothetical protein n=1 Tax=Thermohalobaculum sediminis TaxID=2939436 RepID=UPI0020BD4DA3|nr:hypothetical protein [Limibaculum sediminis]MCL5776416.1 hypothetical protein [Limibaculum sediminis]